MLKVYSNLVDTLPLHRVRFQCTAAVDDFSKAIALEPRYADCWKRRGQARSALGENEAALQVSLHTHVRRTAAGFRMAYTDMDIVPMHAGPAQGGRPDS
jgi:hypothetical protein